MKLKTANDKVRISKNLKITGLFLVLEGVIVILIWIVRYFI
jgi:hypothetical protein